MVYCFKVYDNSLRSFRCSNRMGMKEAIDAAHGSIIPGTGRLVPVVQLDAEGFVRDKENLLQTLAARSAVDSLRFEAAPR